jgi:uncharacterized Zn finger protein
VTRLVCPHCGEYESYQLLSLGEDTSVYGCGKCGCVSQWERTEDGWRIKEETRGNE